jgi:hypothetical protein
MIGMRGEAAALDVMKEASGGRDVVEGWERTDFLCSFLTQSRRRPIQIHTR